MDTENVDEQNFPTFVKFAQAFLCLSALKDSKFDRRKKNLINVFVGRNNKTEKKFTSLSNNYQIDGMLKRIQRLWNKKNYERNELLWIIANFQIRCYFELERRNNYQPWKGNINCSRLWRTWLWNVRKETKPDNWRVNWMKQFSCFNNLDSSRRPGKLTNLFFIIPRKTVVSNTSLCHSIYWVIYSKVSVFLMSLDPRTISQRTNQSRICVRSRDNFKLFSSLAWLFRVLQPANKMKYRDSNQRMNHKWQQCKKYSNVLEWRHFA